MNYGYIRVSTDKQTVENQRYEITKFAKQHGIQINGWIEETVSGTKAPDKRKLGELLKEVKFGDAIICSEISRLGRSLYMIMDILSICMDKGVTIMTIKDNFVLHDDIQTKVLAFAFGLSAEIERNLISQRTKEALEVKKKNGIQLGRPKGSLGQNTKLSPHEDVIRSLIAQDNTYAEVARLYKVDRSTMKRFCAARGINRPFNSNKKSVVINVAENEPLDDNKELTIKVNNTNHLDSL